MRDIEEIKHINENPRAARSEDELFKIMSGRRIEITRRLHGERVEARQAQQS